MTHDDHTFPFGSSSTVSPQCRPEAFVALWWSGGEKSGASEDKVTKQICEHGSVVVLEIGLGRETTFLLVFVTRYCLIPIGHDMVGVCLWYHT